MVYSIVDASNDFADLSNDIGKFKIELCKKYKIDFKEEGLRIITPEDFRFNTLDSIQQNLLSLTGYIRAFMELQRRINFTPEFLRVLNLGVTEEQMEKGLVYKFPIEALVTMIHFQIDSFFGQICALKKDPKTGFYKRMTKVLENITDKEDFQNILQCLANIRNSFHNKGIHCIHKNKWENGSEPEKGTIDITFEYDELKIEFKHNEVIKYNWKSIYLLIKRSVEILKQIISENPKEGKKLQEC